MSQYQSGLFSLHSPAAQTKRLKEFKMWTLLAMTVDVIEEYLY